MPSLSKAWRRISHSQTSLRSKQSSDESSNGSINSRQANQSTNTLDTASADSYTPPSSISQPDLVPSNGSDATITPRRPPMTANGYNRFSVMSSAGMSTAPQSRLSPLAPSITSVSDGSTVHQKILLIRGQIGSFEAVGDLHLSAGDPRTKRHNGLLHIFSHQGSFPIYTVPVVESRFKALVHLQAGRNNLKFEFERARSSHNGTSLPGEHVNWLSLHYVPLNASPPLHLAILVASDSEEKFDAPPSRVSAEGNDLEVAKRKYRMAAYLWQAYTADQMQRNGFFSRCFRLEEEWQPSTLGGIENPQPWRSEARIHVIRLKETVAELRSPDLAQQNENAKDRGGLYPIAMKACKDYFHSTPGQPQYVSAMFLDSHWDAKLNLVTAHAALGGGDGDLNLAIFGSHLLYSYPMCLQHVIPTFNDCTPTDTKYVCNDCGESGSCWEAANIGIGAHMHEVGHLFGLPHRPSGVMKRDYTKLNRTFTVGEPFATRTRSPGKKFLPREEECAWSRLDCLRFRYHPCFKHPMDRYIPVEGGIQVWVIGDEITVSSDAGIAWVEMFADDDELCYAWKEFVPRSSIPGTESPRPMQCPRAIRLIESELKEHLKQQLPADTKKFSKIRLQIFSTTGIQYTVEDLGKLTHKSSVIKMPNGEKGYRSGKLGMGLMAKHQEQELILEASYLKIKEKDILGNENVKAKVIRSVRVYHGLAVDGIEFFHEDGSTQLFGTRGGKPGGDEFVFDTRIGETIAGFYVRAGAWIDGIQIITTMTGRKSPVYGNPTGGAGHTLIPPSGYRIAGLAGSFGDWIDSFQLIVSR